MKRKPTSEGVDPIVWRAAIHEAGHVIAEHVLGLVPLECVLNDAPGTGVVYGRDLHPHGGMVREYVVSCLAGYEAEAHFCGAPVDAVRGDEKDRHLAQEALDECRSHETVDHFEPAARRLVAEHEEAIWRVALALSRSPSRKLLGEELLLVVRSAMGDPVAARELDAFREHPRNRLARLQTDVWKPPTALLCDDFLAPGDGGLLDKLRAGETVVARAHSIEDVERARVLATSGRNLIVAVVADPEESESVDSVTVMDDGTISLTPLPRR